MKCFNDESPEQGFINLTLHALFTWKLCGASPRVTFSAGGPVTTGDSIFLQKVSNFSTIVAL